MKQNSRRNVTSKSVAVQLPQNLVTSYIYFLLYSLGVRVKLGKFGRLNSDTDFNLFIF